MSIYPPVATPTGMDGPTPELDRPLVAVVLAGGVGSRLYPASRSHRPKQFLALDGERSLLTRTVERVGFADRVLVATRAAFADQAHEHVAEAGVSTPTEVVVEPAGKDTGPALAYATHLAGDRAGERSAAGGEPVVLAVPSDHHVAGDFETVARRAARAAVEADALVTLGVEPTRPETGYGYIEPGTDRGRYREVDAFHEKPDPETAEAYVEAGHLWNAGIFAWTPGRFVEEARDSPLADLVEALEADDAEHTDPEAAFAGVEPVSVDYAVLERAGRVVVVPADLEWDDLGAWDALARILADEADEAGNVALGEALTLDARDNVVASDGTHVSLVGVEGLAVVAWDDRVLVVPTDQAQRVRDVVSELDADGRF